MDLSKYIPALEAILFAGGEPVPAARIAAALELSEQNVEKTAVLLEQKLSSKDSGIELLKLSDGYQLATKKQFEEPIRTVFELRRSTPLSSAAFEVLAVVAYNQPVTKAYVEQVRGVDCSGVMSSLVLKGLIEECGRLDLPGRPILYGTTDTFLRCFGLSDLSELPALPEEEAAKGFENTSAKTTVEEPTLEDFASDRTHSDGTDKPSKGTNTTAEGNGNGNPANGSTAADNITADNTDNNSTAADDTPSDN